jgi:hypothetical protein
MAKIFPEVNMPAARLDSDMRGDLADSLAHLHAVDERLRRHDADEVAQALGEIRSHRVMPGLVGRYFDLVLALQEESADAARRLFDEILRLAPRSPTLAVLPFTREELGDDLERYDRLVDLGSAHPGFLGSPRPESWDQFRSLAPAALDLIEAADPALRAELDAMVVQIIAAAPTAGPTSRRFGGVSSLMLWGAVILNAETHGTLLALADGLVHEIAHHLLFGLSRVEPLVANAVEDSYPSPLRRDRRPMDGVYHATFVCARLHYFHRRLLDLGLVGGQAARLAEQAALGCREGFLSGIDTIQQHARLTPNGREIMASAESYFAQAG